MAMTDLRHMTVSTVMRPPRVVVLFRGDKNWRAWARLALRAISSTWGGGGHLIIPYDETGQVHPELIAAVRMYDPDHIVSLRPTLAEREAIDPGAFPLLVDGVPVDGVRREELLRSFTDHAPQDYAAEDARRRLAATCTVFVDQIEDRKIARVRTTSSSGKGLPGPHVSDVLGGNGDAYLAVPDTWLSDVSLFAAATIGTETRGDSRCAKEPDGSDILRFILTPTELFPIRIPPELFSESTGIPAEPPIARFRQLDRNLKVVLRGYSPNKGAIVFGDTAADFALANAARVLRGYGIWVPTSISGDGTLRETVSAALGTWLAASQSSGVDLTAGSASLSEREVDEQVAQIDRSMNQCIIEPDPEDAFMPSRTFDWSSNGMLSRVIGEGVGDAYLVPVEVDDAGTVTMSAPFSLPVAPAPRMRDDSHPYWYVDVDFAEGAMPRGRGLGPSVLVGGRRPDETIARSSQGGITVQAQSAGLVVSGGFLSGSMPRPVLRDLSIRDWVRAMANEDGLSVRYSTPGQHAQLVATRLGSRSALLDLVSGSFRPVLESLRLVKTSAERAGARKPPEPGVEPLVVIGDMSFITFSHVRHLVGGGSIARETLDELCHLRLMRRGLILHCVECGRPSFIGIDDLGQLYDCPRCGAGNRLRQSSWRCPDGEPFWFYDLHGALRELMSTGGHVPLLAAASLRDTRGDYADCAEVEFFDKNDAPIAEIDLIAHVNREVIVCEAKTSTGLGSSASKRDNSARKLARIATLLRADAVLLASSETNPWSTATVNAVEAALAANDSEGRVIEVRTKCGL